MPRVVDERPVAKVSLKVFWRRGTISPFFHDSRKSFVSYRSDTASHFPSCEIAEAIRLVCTWRMKSRRINIVFKAQVTVCQAHLEVEFQNFLVTGRADVLLLVGAVVLPVEAEFESRTSPSRLL